MSKILDATCDDQGVVTCEGVEIPEAEVLTAGKQTSSGVLFLYKDKAYYLTVNTADLEATLDKTSDALQSISEALTKIATTLTAIGAGMTGPTTAPPPTLATDVAEINSKVTLINSAKSDLDDLKGALK